ncbi:MAG TPA: response regulator [Myxococcales bacterium]|nr:response regulator [Myxococcales bacterium]
MTLSTRPVYVVDGSAEIRAMVSEVLRSLGYEAAAYESPARALDAITRRPPSALLTDLVMAPMAGDELCAKVKENRALSRIPVIVFTEADSALEVMRSWRAGADDFLTKPVQRGQLVSNLEALSRAGAAEEVASPLHRPGEHHCLLFVDDSRFFRTVLGGALEHSGFRLLYARNGQEALELAKTHGPVLDAALSDLVMPGMDGVEFAAALRRVPGWERKPVLMMSASEATPERVEAAEALTGSKLLEKRLIPIEAIVSKVSSAVEPQVGQLRAAERVPFFSVVEFRAAGTSELLSGFSYDVSPGGVFVRSLTPLPAGTAVEMRMKLSAKAPVPSCFGQVVWANQYRLRTSFSYPVGMGVRFTHLEPDQQAELQKVVKVGGKLIAA